MIKSITSKDPVYPDEWKTEITELYYKHKEEILQEQQYTDRLQKLKNGLVPTEDLKEWNKS